MRFPRRYTMHSDDIERQRLARMARERHNERQAQRRKALRSLGISRRSWLIMGLAALVLLGVLLPFHDARRKSRAQPEPSKEVRAVRSLWALRTALEGFRDDCGRYPSLEEGLQALVTPLDINGWKGPYIDLLRLDPWHTPFQYDATQGTVMLYSCGADRTAGTADDIPAPRPDYTLLQQRKADDNGQRRIPPQEFSIKLRE